MSAVRSELSPQLWSWGPSAGPRHGAAAINGTVATNSLKIFADVVVEEFLPFLCSLTV